MFQKTIKKSITISGKGLHTGQNSTITLHPANTDAGIQIHRSYQKPISVNCQNILFSPRSISLGTKQNNIMTVEHLLASLYILGVNNLHIEINDKSELPALDGSALLYYKNIMKAGIKIQKKPRRIFFLTKPVTLSDKDKFIIGLPSNHLRITYYINFPHPLLRHQNIHFDLVNQKIFKKKIAPARTFGFLNEVEALLKKGLAHGGDLNNAVVLSDTGYVNKKLRFPDECIRHKVLDFIGALGVLSIPIRAHFICCKSGHLLDLKYMKKLEKTLK